MTKLLLPQTNTFLGLPASNPDDVLAGAHSINNKDELRRAVEILRMEAAGRTTCARPSFLPSQMRDLHARPAIAVIADGATLHANVLTETQQELQRRDGQKAFQLGRILAEKGWRVVLPAYNGLCEDVIKGVRAGSGEYIVTTTRRSLRYNDNGSPLLPQNDPHGFHIVTNTLAESKSVLFALSDSLVYLPGGLRTLDIFTDHFVLEQTGMFRDYRILGDHRRKLFLLNDDGFWQPVMNLTKHMIDKGFANEKHLGIIHEMKGIDPLINELAQTIYPGGPWQPRAASQHGLFIPTKAVTLAAELSRASVMQQIIPVKPEFLKTKLAEARKKEAAEFPVDPALKEIFDGRIAAVYCASRDGRDSHFIEIAHEGGKVLSELGYGMIYGGSLFGNMGAWANGSIEGSGPHRKSNILAVTPFAFLLGESSAANEGFHPGITATIAVPGMQERKMIMTALSSNPDPSKTLNISVLGPGAGWGSFDETIEEMVIINELGVTHKDIIVINHDGYMDNFFTIFKQPIERGYMKNDMLGSLAVVDTMPQFRDALLNPANRSAARGPALA